MTSSLHHNDVMTIKILSLQKFYQSKKKSLETFLNFKKTTNKRYKIKKNFLFDINNIIFKKLSITKRVFSAKIQCTNVTLARKL